MLSMYTQDQINALLAAVGHPPSAPPHTASPPHTAAPRRRPATARSTKPTKQVKPSIDKVDFVKFDKEYVYHPIPMDFSYFFFFLLGLISCPETWTPGATPSWILTMFGSRFALVFSGHMPQSLATTPKSRRVSWTVLVKASKKRPIGQTSGSTSKIGVLFPNGISP